MKRRAAFDVLLWAGVSLVGVCGEISLVRADPDRFVVGFGATLNDNADDVIEVVESGNRHYVLTGWVNQIGRVQADALVAKYDVNGLLEWTRVYGDDNPNDLGSVGRFIVETAGGYLVAGTTDVSDPVGKGDILLMKFLTDGTLVWMKTIGSSTGKETCESITTLSSGGYLLTGYTSSLGAGGCDFMVVEVDANGDPTPSGCFTYGGPYHEYGWQTIKTSDGYFVGVGWTDHYEEQNKGHQIVATKFALNGTMAWRVVFGAGNGANDGTSSVVEAKDGNYIIGGGTTAGFGGRQDALLVKLDKNNGHVLWAKALGTGYWDFCADLIRDATDDSLVLGGWLGRSDLPDVEEESDFLLTKVHQDGGVGPSYRINVGNFQPDFGRGVWETSDNGYILAGRTWSHGSGQSDVMLAKFDSDRLTCRPGWISVDQMDFQWGTETPDFTVNGISWIAQPAPLVRLEPTLTPFQVCH